MGVAPHICRQRDEVHSCVPTEQGSLLCCVQAPEDDSLSFLSGAIEGSVNPRESLLMTRGRRAAHTFSFSEGLTPCLLEADSLSFAAS